MQSQPLQNQEPLRIARAEDELPLFHGVSAPRYSEVVLQFRLPARCLPFLLPSFGGEAGFISEIAGVRKTTERITAVPDVGTGWRCRRRAGVEGILQTAGWF